ncbi:MAG TPA: DNA-directed RNA polymerase subunit beta' [Patescibacteria group bacterium]
MTDLLDFEALKVTIASESDVLEWSHGEVTKPETINYRTLKPEKDGLFDERIFGPTKDWECYCGKYKRIRFRGVICDKCGVEVTQSRVRRERMGHIKLASPVAHAWFFKGAPSKLGLLLDISPRDIESIVYFASYLVISVDEDKREKAIKSVNDNFEKEKKELTSKSEKEISQLEKETEKEASEIKSKVKSKEQQDLKIEEIELKSRQRIAQIRENNSVEVLKIATAAKALVDLVRSVSVGMLLYEEEYLRLFENGLDEFLEVGMGGEALLKILEKIDLSKLSAILREEIQKSTGQKHIKLTKKLRIVEGMRKAGISPTTLILKILPVLPPDLRPMVQLSGGRFATSDLNDLYRRVINRNNRLRRLMDLGAPEIILRNEKRMLQEAVDALIDSTQRPYTRSAVAASQLRSLSDMLRGKQGRFRQNLLGKRVDYSGRSVIVVGPELNLNQAGLPKEMALEMFKPFVLRELIAQGLAPNVKSAKHVLERRPPEIWDILETITKNHPVLLNRAPTLHRLGIQAFFPVLIEGDAIRIHPCVCAGFNADFDGDQMAVHVPLSVVSQEEAQDLMLASKNLLRPADGSPITLPNKEMALGMYYLTSLSGLESTSIFGSFKEAILAYQCGKIQARTKITVYERGEKIETTVGRILFNNLLPKEISYINEAVKASTIKQIISKVYDLGDEERTAKLIDNLKVLGFEGATFSGLSVSVFDCRIIPNKDQIIEKAEKRVEEVEGTYRTGLITRDELRRLSNEIWVETTEEIADLTWKNFQDDNSIRLISDSGGSRATGDQIKQLAGMRGLVADPSGKIVPLPTKSNFREGLSVFEYFTSSRGARKGFADRALKTAESGYLTRRLIDVAHDVIIRSQDCGTKEGLEISKKDNRQTKFTDRLLGRIAATDIVSSRSKKAIVKRNEEIDEEKALSIEKSQIESVLVRSPLTCAAKYGMCAACYGRNPIDKKLVNIGTPVGVVAAQSIGEPGTQLTMRTFHLGGIVGLDITQGLPRVEELFEARIPKVLAPISEIAGKVSIEESAEGFKVKVRSTKLKPVVEREYIIPATSEVLVADDDMIDAGTPLCSGHLDVKEILSVKGIRESQKYIISGVQEVYEGQGVPINDKHFEIIVRKMSDKVRVESSGDTTLLPNELVDKVRFQSENNRVLAEGGEPATAQIVILGITRGALYTESFLSAASFQETTNVLTDAAIEGKIDRLVGLKENVIIGRLIPTDPKRAQSVEFES